MRIALLTDGIWPYRIGGMQKHSYYLVKYLARNGVDIDLYHHNQSTYDIDKLEFFSAEEKQHIRSFVFPFPKHFRWPDHYINESDEHSKMMYGHFLKQPPVDFIYSKGYAGLHFIKQKQVALLEEGNAHGIPPIGLRLHGYEIFQGGNSLWDAYNRLVYLPLVRYLNNCADYVYSYGDGITDIIKRNFRNIEDRIIEIPTGIEADWLYDKNINCCHPLRFAFLGRYEKRKGIKELNLALTHLVGKTDFEFHFIGPIPESEQIVSPHVKYHGVVGDAAKIRDVLRKTDVFVLPSHSEGMPNVVLEAMASGCAVLATDVGAVKLMVGDDNGWLIKPRMPLQLEDMIREIILLPSAEINRRKIRSVEKVRQHFLWEDVIRLEIAALEKITGKKVRQPQPL
jgi:glycosyltransferase involved in cell wall biosynthesis